MYGRNGTRIEAGDEIGNYADNSDDALCEGGGSSGPHVHFSLLNLDGTDQSLNGKYLGTYKVFNKNNRDYEKDCNIFYFKERNGEKYCAGNEIKNRGSL